MGLKHRQRRTEIGRVGVFGGLCEGGGAIYHNNPYLTLGGL